MLRSRRRAASALLALAVFAACSDAPDAPTALLVAPETQAALEVASSLPGLPELAAAADRADLEPAAADALAGARALWASADSASDPTRARALRGEANRAAAPLLAQSLDSAALAGAQRKLQRWSELAGAALKGADLPELAQAVADGGALLRRARESARAGDRADAVLATLDASERLSETTPRAVALRLTTADELALDATRRGMAPRPDDAAGRRLERIQRLVRGAREAIEAEKYDVAIRRAYYARQLLGPAGASASP
ncbi:MAG TPA: hypothetical protein VFQ38_00755 [Longimicrobiales bacterium]|nr:hypothetical protein [Longimicrobiales bacterium]